MCIKLHNENNNKNLSTYLINKLHVIEIIINIYLTNLLKTNIYYILYYITLYK